MSDIVLRTDALGDLDVRSAMLRMGIRANWTGTVLVASETLPPIGDPASLRFTREDGTVDVFSGVVRRCELTPGTVELSVTVVGGAGKLLLPEIPARHHAAGSGDVPAGLVALGIAQAAGEALAPGVEAALDATALPQWTRYAGPANDALDVFAGVLGFAWRVLDTGAIWCGAETWPAVTSSDVGAFYWTGDPRDGMVLYECQGAPLRPGTEIDGRRATEVTYWFNAEDPAAMRRGLRCEVRVAMPGDPVYLPPVDPYRANWPGSVVAQDGDGGPLQIVCDSPVMGDDLREIQARTGWPGCKMTIPEGTRIRLGFENADPRGAYAASIDQDPDASEFLALLNDTTKNGNLTAVDSTKAPVVFTYTPEGGGTVTNASIDLVGLIFGPGHKYVKGVPAS